MDEIEIKEEPFEFDNNVDNISYRYNFSKRFVGLEYPGVIKNVDKALQTLGGITKLSNVFSSETPRRVELTFRPSDIFAKPTVGDKESTVGLVLKVRIVRKKSSNDPLAQSEEPFLEERSIKSVNVLGICKDIYRFNYFADFQYLPATYENNRCINIYDRIVPDGPRVTSWLDIENDFFFPPSSMSRMDTTEGYKYSNSKKDPNNSERHIIGRTRHTRSGFTKLFSFADQQIPDKPFKAAFTILKAKHINEQYLTKLKKLFEKRPIWSKNGILANTNIPHDQCKYLLPAVAYYFTNGPWRVLWIRYGYDPRKDYTARIYQTFDFRLKSDFPLQPKRTYITNKSLQVVRKKAVLLNQTHSVKYKTKKKRDPTCYIFKPGTIPDSKQMFFQYCDLHVPEIEAMLARLPEPTADATCNEKSGWLPSGFDERCREIVHDLIKEEYLKRQAEVLHITDDDDDNDNNMEGDTDENVDDEGENVDDDADWEEISNETSDDDNDK